MTSRITFNESNHTYRLKGYRWAVPSVSALVRTLHQFDNDEWVMGEVAMAVSKIVPGLSGHPATEWRRLIKECAMAERRRDAEFGTAVHHYAAHLWTGNPVEVPDAYAGHVKALATWWEAEQPSLICAERVVYMDSDDDYGLTACAGTFDLLIDHPDRGVGLLDLKSWAPWRKGEATAGKRAQWAMQLAAYAGMHRMQADDPDDDDVLMRDVDWLGVLHVGQSDAALWVVDPESRLRAAAQVECARMLRGLPKPGMELVG